VEPVRRADAILWLPTFAASMASAVGWGEWVTTQEAGWLMLALFAQVIAGTVIAAMAAPDRRTLVAFVALLTPIIGPIAGMYIDQLRGEGGADLLADIEPVHHRIDGAAIARALTGALPPCEALVSGDAEARAATLMRLTQRGRSEDIAILRWACEQPGIEVSVEAALALAELEQRFEERLTEARATAAESATYEAHAALVTAICDGVTTGIVDAPLISKLTSEARKHYVAAHLADPTRAPELVTARARLELAARRPDLALAVTKRALAHSADPALIRVFTEAAYAARRFDLVPGLRSRVADAGAA
jgi:hypothetical protein